jgi:HK97 gp10 family phage protein
VVKIDGLREFDRAMSGLPRAVRKEAGRAVFVAADTVKAEAQRLVSTGATSGANHVPSRPGEPPNTDTGQLQRGIVSRRTGDLKAEVMSSAEYSAALEFGTSRMAARPFMRPALAKSRRKILRLFDKVKEKVLR